MLLFGRSGLNHGVVEEMFVVVVGPAGHPFFYMKGCIENVASFCSASLQIAVYQVSQPISAYLHAMIRREIARGVETLFFIAR